MLTTLKYSVEIKYLKALLDSFSILHNLKNEYNKKNLISCFTDNALHK